MNQRKMQSHRSYDWRREANATTVHFGLNRIENWRCPDDGD